MNWELRSPLVQVQPCSKVGLNAVDCDQLGRVRAIRSMCVASGYLSYKLKPCDRFVATFTELAVVCAHPGRAYESSDPVDHDVHRPRFRVPMPSHVIQATADVSPDVIIVIDIFRAECVPFSSGLSRRFTKEYAFSI